MTHGVISTRLLVIGTHELSEAVSSALPAADVQHAESAIEGVWRMGSESFDSVLLSMSVGEAGPRVLASLRELAPGVRILLSCPPVDESLTRRFLDRGADDYLLEPPSREEIEAAFGPTASHRDAPIIDDASAEIDATESESQAAAPAESRLADMFPAEPASARDDAVMPAPAAESPQEIVALAEIMMRLREGRAATLRRFAELVRGTFDARGARIDVDGESATVGEVEPADTVKPLTRDGVIVGAIMLGSSRTSRTGVDPGRLDQYAKLIDAVAQQLGDCERLHRLAHVDELSGLSNRRHFDERLGELIAEAMARRSRLSVFLFDIDNFKAYNDRHGHATGDGLIREIGFLLRKCFRERDIIARYGGDEFGVIFWDSGKPRVAGSQHPSEPAQLARRFCETIAKHEFKCIGPGAPGPVTISGGLATFPWDGRTQQELIEAADHAALAAKRSGKNGIALAGDQPATPEQRISRDTAE